MPIPLIQSHPVSTHHQTHLTHTIFTPCGYIPTPKEPTTNTDTDHNHQVLADPHPQRPNGRRGTTGVHSNFQPCRPAAGKHTPRSPAQQERHDVSMLCALPSQAVTYL